MKKNREAIENLEIVDNDELSEAIWKINRRLNILTLFLLAVTIGHREKCLGEKLTEEDKASLADTLGLSLDRIRKIIRESKEK
jgi:hypothetical protein